MSERTTPPEFQAAADAWYHAAREEADADAAMRTPRPGDRSAWSRHRDAVEAVAREYRKMLRLAMGGAR